ncbi:MAG: hypothetical protein AMJ84_00020 [Acidithiobacillales bacterium SM23_46]|nr:MAG: hypothetical protein AMJ84_00020 [Acidithiobacillales bacterium SM23_46]KPL28995.1 MAG: hypothetical protein AMJ72_00095 [Acidithiobacillales bacterium SM1_46]
MKPNPAEYNPDPEYLRQLIASTGKTQRQVAEEILGCSERAIRMWIAGDRRFPYAVQFTLEAEVLGVL